jgi:DNA mismatch endonuclease (patch repair protein)
MDWKKNGLKPSSAAATAMGKANPSRDTKPEIQLRSALHRLGLRFRKNYRVIDGDKRPPAVDIVFVSARVAVQVHGVFWHGKLSSKKSHAPKSNSEYWQKKFADNQAWDKRVTKRLKRAGWRVVTVWDDWPLERQVRAVVRKLQEV